MLKLRHNFAEETKNICSAKNESTVDHSTVTKWFKIFRSGCKNFGYQKRSLKSKSGDSEAVFEVIESNPTSSTWRESGKLGIVLSSLVCHRHNHGKPSEAAKLCCPTLPIYRQTFDLSFKKPCCMLPLGVNNNEERIYILSWYFSNWFTVGKGDKPRSFYLRLSPGQRQAYCWYKAGQYFISGWHSTTSEQGKLWHRDFRTSRKWRQHEMHNLEYKLFYHHPPPKYRHVCEVKQKIKMFNNSSRTFLVMMCAKKKKSVLRAVGTG